MRAKWVSVRYNSIWLAPFESINRQIIAAVAEKSSTSHQLARGEKLIVILGWKVGRNCSDWRSKCSFSPLKSRSKTLVCGLCDFIRTRDWRLKNAYLATLYVAWWWAIFASKNDFVLQKISSVAGGLEWKMNRNEGGKPRKFLSTDIRRSTADLAVHA